MNPDGTISYISEKEYARREQDKAAKLGILSPNRKERRLAARIEKRRKKKLG